MKCRLLFLFLLLSLGARAQIIDTYEGLFIAGVLCNSQGERLGNNEVEALTEYGFELDRYKSLRKQSIIADSFFLFAFVPFTYTAFYDEIIGQKIEKNNVRYSKVDRVLGTPSIIVMAGAAVWRIVCYKKMQKEVDILNSKMNLLPSNSGFGLSLTF